MDGYRDTCPEEVDGFRKEVKGLIMRLLQVLEDQFKDEVKVQPKHKSESQISVILG